MIMALFRIYPDLILENTTLMVLTLYGYYNVRYYYSVYFVPILVAICPMPRV